MAAKKKSSIRPATLSKAETLKRQVESEWVRKNKRKSFGPTEKQLLSTRKQMDRSKSEQKRIAKLKADQRKRTEKKR